MFDLLGFGKSDPRKMPGHLFFGSLHLDYSTAVKADISKQNFSVCPRHWYINAAFRCGRCKKTFVFTVDEQRFWYEELGFWIDAQPRECENCRRELRELKTLRQEYDRDLAGVLVKNAPIENKQRIVEVIDSLDAAGVRLPEKIYDNRRILMKQIAVKK